MRSSSPSCRGPHTLLENLIKLYRGAKFYGPYNALLNYLFPSDEEYMIVPQYKHPEESRSIDFTTIFVIEYQEKPIFFMEIKPSEAFSSSICGQPDAGAREGW